METLETWKFVITLIRLALELFKLAREAYDHCKPSKRRSLPEKS